MRRMLLLPMFFFLSLSLFYFPIYAGAQTTVTLSSSSCGSGLAVEGTWNSATGECDISSSQTLAGSVALEIPSGVVLVIEPGATFTIPTGDTIQIDAGGAIRIIAGNGGNGGNGASNADGASGGPGASSSIANDGTITNSGTISLIGGNGGNGGWGGNGGFGPPGSNPDTFNGGNGGPGGNGGSVFISNHVSIANSGTINGNGGNGGTGGTGGIDAANFLPSGGLQGGSGSSDGTGGTGGSGSSGTGGFVASNGNAIGAGGNGASGGSGGNSSVTNNGSITNCGTIYHGVTGNPVNVCPATTTSVTLQPDPSVTDQQVTLAAIVSTSSGTVPDGEMITFYENGTSIGTGATSGGHATFVTSFANSGTYSITATYSGDGNFPSSTSNAIIQTVTNSPPIANSDSYSINENTVLSVPSSTSVLSNDNDPDGDMLTASLVTGPTHGTLTLNSDGSFTYTPNVDFFGSDSFVYHANDGHGNTATATSNININQIICSAGSFLSPGSNTCTPAPAGSFALGPGATSATQCPLGEYQPNIGQTSCILSPAGSYVDTIGATSATQCLAGTFTSLEGQSSCTPALPGSFATGPGATSASLCPLGSFTSSAGQSSCTPSPAGSYVGSAGATSSTLCAPGSYQPNTGQSSCTLAQPGFFVSISGATQQTQCPFGTTSDVPGSTSCHAVSTVGKVTGGGNIGTDQNFGFDVDSKDGKTFKGHLEYHAKTSTIDLDSITMTQLFVDSSMTHAIFAGQATVDNGHHDDKKNSSPTFAFLVSVTDPDKKGDRDTFSITVTNSTGNVTYQNSGTVKGHIEIHNVDPDDDNSHSNDSENSK